MSIDHRMTTVLVVVASSMLLAVQVQSAFATNPNYRTDRQLHAVSTIGNTGTIYKSTPSTLTDKANVSWAKAFIGTHILTWDSFTSNAVGAGWMKIKLNNGNYQSSMSLYYYDANNGFTGLVFEGSESGNTFTATTLQYFYDSTNQCYVWARTVGSYGEDKCIKNFNKGLGEVWSISNSESNSFSSSTEYTNLKYYPYPSGSPVSWSSAGGGSIYCHNDSPFAANQVTNVNNWDVIPPGSATSCANDLTSPKPILS